jgi:hypothetical protein
MQVEYWDGAAWAAVPGGLVVSNDRVWAKFAFAPLSTSKIRVVVSGALAGYSRITEVEAWGEAGAPPPPPRVNFAAAASGATAASSSTQNAGTAALAAINGDRLGLHWGSDPATGSGWHDATANAYPDWLEVAFAGPRTISEVDVYSVQDNYASPSAPTPETAFGLYGVTDFEVQYWDGAAWAAIPGATAAGNNRVWRKLTFAPVTTGRIRVVVTGAQAGYSRITEVEAYQ